LGGKIRREGEKRIWREREENGTGQGSAAFEKKRCYIICNYKKIPSSKEIRV